MKSFSVGLVIYLSLLALSFAAPSHNHHHHAPEQSSPAPSHYVNKEEKAIQECNVTNPVQRNVRNAIAVGIATGERIQISHEEKCHFYCYLQKVGFLDQNGNIKGQGLVKYTLKESPEFAKYSDVIISLVFQIGRSTKGIEDKCQKGFVAYHQFTQGVFIIFIAEGLRGITGIKDKIVNSMQDGQSIDQEISQNVQQYLAFFDALISSQAKEYQQQIENNAQSQASNAQSQVSNGQSQVFNGQSQASDVQSQGSSHLQQQAQNAQSQVFDAQSQGSSSFQQQAQNAQSQVSDAQSQASDAQAQVSPVFQQQAQNAQSQVSNAQDQAANVQSQGSSVLQQNTKVASLL